MMTWYVYGLRRLTPAKYDSVYSVLQLLFADFALALDVPHRP